MFSFFSSARTVLLMGDNSLHVYYVQGKSARLVESVPWDTDDFAHHVARIIIEECRSRPVLLLNDMTEQYYKKDSVVKVSTLDKAAMLNRKLNVAFPNHSTKGIMELKEKHVSKARTEDGALPQEFYILSAIPDTNMLSNSIEAIRLSGARVKGACLLPCESSSFVNTLSSKISGESLSSASYGWSILITQHQDGGIRQIVTKGVDLALTRMTPITKDPSKDPNGWADDVAREFNATIDYISRFGYKQSDSLRVIVLAPLSAGALLESAIKINCMFSCLAIDDASRIMDWPVSSRLRGADSQEIYADSFHVIWAANKRKLAMPMNSRAILDIARPRNISVAVVSVLVILFLAQIGQSIVSYKDMSHARKTIEEREVEKNQLEVQYQAEVKRNESLGIDVALLKSSLAIYDKIKDYQIDLDSILFAVNKALGQNMRVNKIKISKLGDKGLFSNDLRARGKEQFSPWKVKLQFTFPSTIDADKGNTDISTLRDRIQGNLPDYKVSVLKFLKDYGFDKEVIVEDSATTAGDVRQDFLATIEIVESEK